MAFLVLDLDLTAIIASIEKKTSDCLHPHHSLSEPLIATAGNGQRSFEIYIINPDELAKVIEEACTQHEGIIVLTAGYWDRMILELLAENLPLSSKAKEKLKAAYFHSPITDAHLFQLDPSRVRHIPKGERLQRIIAANPELRDKTFIPFDDAHEHNLSYSQMQTPALIKPVLATPSQPDKSYYSRAITALRSSHSISSRFFHPSKQLHPNIKVSYKRKRGDEENIDHPGKKARTQ